VEAWLVRIAHRKAIDVVRARNRRAVPVGALPESGATDPEPVEHTEDLWQALRELPFKQRACVVYHHVAGLPYAEVATIVGGSPEAARRAASDGIARLRTTYGARA
jgi:RNA polymerase sigma factor (sigma-70 family)